MVVGRRTEDSFSVFEEALENIVICSFFLNLKRSHLSSYVISPLAHRVDSMYGDTNIRFLLFLQVVRVSRRVILQAQVCSK